eukprot:TRINITY_DN196_c0_g1_i2.p2 TRINITY_DN196_c0_g1~~TRINITY_DN196_c0_g1_i2.p2  ORF type:complete len:135 (-),score=41.25 TRINITY_DN196_c0_g1_i2:68-472(-)
MVKIIRYIPEAVNAADAAEMRTVKLSEKTEFKPIVVLPEETVPKSQVEEKAHNVQVRNEDDSLWERDIHGKIRAATRRKHQEKFEMGQGITSHPQPQYRFKTNREIKNERREVLKHVLHSRLRAMEQQRLHVNV